MYSNKRSLTLLSLGVVYKESISFAVISDDFGHVDSVGKTDVAIADQMY